MRDAAGRGTPHGRRRIRTARSWSICLGIAGILAGLVACAGGRAADGLYRDGAHRFTLRLPPADWRPQRVEGGALAFRSPELGAALALLADCEDPEPGELPWVARHLFWGLQDRRILERAPLVVHGTAAMRTRLTARLDGRPIEVEGVTLRRDGCLYDFAYLAPPAVFARGRAAFEAFLDGFTPLARP
jgi:hypothetical protein